MCGILAYVVVVGGGEIQLDRVTSSIVQTLFFYLLLISWGLKKLERLNLRSCRLISDHGIGHLAGLDSVGNYSSSPSSLLKDLGLQDCQKLTDDALKHISVGLPDLNKINLSFCVSVTDTGLKSLAKLSSLEDLNLRSCDNVSDIGISFLSSSEDGGCSKRLQALDVSFCGNVTDAGLKHISSGMSGLRSLSITTCAVTDDGLGKMASSLKALEELNMGQCVAVTDRGVDVLADNMTSLRSLDIYGCPRVSQAVLKKVKRMPGMRRLNLEL